MNDPKNSASNSANNSAGTGAGTGANTASIATLRTQLQKLQALHSGGVLETAEYNELKAPLERKLLEQVMAGEPGSVAPAPSSPSSPSSPSFGPLAADAAPVVAATAAATTAPITQAARPSPRLLGVLLAGVLALAVLGYWRTGSPSAPSAGAPGAMAQSPANTEEAAPALDEQQFAAAVEKLAAKLKEQPDNAEGWAMLARSYARLGRTAEALPAFKKALSLQGQDARLLTDYADVLALQNNRSLEGEPGKLLAQALKIDPQNPKALALAGTAAFDRKDFKTAVRLWEQLGQVVPPESGFLPQLQASIDQARELGGLPKGARLAAAAVATSPATVPAGTPAAGDSAVAAPSNTNVRGRVRLSAAVAQLAAPDDTVFIYARATQGPRMPLAILRYQVKDLPLLFTLDDNTAMAPAMRLSLHPQVVVSARVSKSGQAAPAVGDLLGQSAPVSNTAQGLVIEINEVVKN